MQTSSDSAIQIPYRFWPEKRPYQLSILGNEAKNKVLVLHRRAGKTALAVNKLIIEACKPENKGRTYWYIAPTYSQGKEIVWADPRMLFYFLPPELIEKRNESELWVKTFNDTRIVIKGGEEPDSLLGSDPFGVVIDETQSQKEELYERIIRPILAANGGWVWFLGTPRFKDHFHQKFIYASQTPGWQSYQLSALDSGIIPMNELEEIRANTPEDLFKQEYEAVFLDGQGVVFRNIKDICTGSMDLTPKKGHTYCIGIDLARKTDFTVLTVYDQSTNSVPYIERFNMVDWNYQKAKILALSLQWGDRGKPAPIKIDSTGVGDPIYQDLQRAGLLVRPIVFTNTLKEDIIRGLQIRFDHRTLTLPNYAPLVNELEVFQEEILPSGKSRFAAPQGLQFHDDCFVKGTAILTDRGQVPIEQIKIGDMVRTRVGFRPVVMMRSKRKKVIKRLGLVGTPDHPVITRNGDKGLAHVCDSDILYVWNEKLSCIEEKSTTGILCQNEGSSGSISGGTTNGNLRRLPFIGRYGSMLSATFQRVSLFITRTKTLLIIRSKILQPFLRLNIQGNISASTLPVASKRGKIIKTFSSPLPLLPPAKSVGSRLLSLARRVQDFVEDCVDSVHGGREEVVYNLQVAGQPEYFANNILVHNCVISLALAVYQAPPVQVRDSLDRKSLLMEKYKTDDRRRWAPKNKALYNWADM